LSPSQAPHSAPSRFHSWLFAALLLFAAAEITRADQMIAHAQAREKMGDAAGAAELYSAWLRANPGATGSAPVFGACYRMEPDFQRLIELSSWYLGAAQGTPGAAGQFQRIARLFALAARPEDAARAYMSAFAEGATSAALLSASLLFLECNDSPGMLRSLTMVSGKSASAGKLLESLTALQSGDNALAREKLSELASQTG
jgi:hypothetical protein